MTIRAERFKILVRVIFVVLIAVMNGQMMQILVAAFFATELALSLNRNDESAYSIIAFPGEISTQRSAPARAEKYVSGFDCFPAYLTWRLFSTSARTEVLSVSSCHLHCENLAAALTRNFLARFLSASEKAFGIFHARLDRASVRTKPRCSISSESPRERFIAALTFVGFLTICRTLRFEKTILRTKSRYGRVSGSVKSPLAAFTFESHFPQVYNVWPGR
jgi:hypothetical protein